MTKSMFLTCLLLSPLTAAPPAKGEPTNAAEIAAKKAAADEPVDEQYAAWVNNAFARAASLGASLAGEPRQLLSTDPQATEGSGPVQCLGFRPR